jgi:two-component system, LytTR family, sensor kinase
MKGFPLSRIPVRWLVLTTLVGLLMFAYNHLDDLARGVNDQPALGILIEELTGVYGAALLFPFARWMARRVPLDAHAAARLPLHAGAVVLFSLAHTSFNWLSRTLLFPLAGLGAYHYGFIIIRYFMELPIDIVIYTLFVGGVWTFDGWARERARALKAAQLEAQLTQAQVQNLRLQLQPHFLFNALNTISSAMYDDPAAADAMLSRLSKLLRVSLRTAQTQEITLGEELEALSHYTALLAGRFGGQLHVESSVDESTRHALVPSLMLQPLVENAVRHGNLSRTGRGRIEVRGRAAGDRLILEIEDDGPGLEGGSPATRADGSGVGLAATGERLRLLYGDKQDLHLGRGRLGGLCVRLELPLTTAGSHARTDC